ncbi:MAG: tripartite tricarboxylate transporter permease, partial [Rhizobiales bacterium]|nr:tripartite tricarboxylate transporter permease [Hyphomicrobiales bacterium]
PTTALIMLAGIYYGAQYGGSTTSILMNVPGESSAVVTAIDGHQMARQGRAGVALAVAAIGSFVAGTIATFFIAFLAPPLTELALEFGPPEYFALMVLGLVSAVALASGSMLKAVAMLTMGLLLGLTGRDIYSGLPRFTFGSSSLLDGIDFVALAVGIFGLSEILRNLENNISLQVLTQKITGLMPSREDVRRIVGPILRGTGLGAFLGILPGGGAVLSSFVSYMVEKRVSRRPEQFSKGAIEGVAGPESANNAGAQTSFIPMLTLGIPSNPVMALMIGAFIMQGIMPGPNVISSRPELFWGLITSMWIGNVLLLVLNLPLVGLWVRLLSIPYDIIVPIVLVFSTVGVYCTGQNALQVVLLALFSLLGYLFVKSDCEPAPLILGFILGPLLEEHFRRSMIIGRGDLTIFVSHPLSAVTLALALAMIIVASLPKAQAKRDEVFTE